MNTLNINDNLCKVFTKSIYYYCFSINDNKKTFI